MHKVEELENKNLFDNRDALVYANRPKSLSEMFERTVNLYSDREALADKESRLTYKDVAEKVDRLAYNLKYVWQIKKGDRVAIALGNIIEYPVIIFAVAQIGAVVVPLNVRMKRQEFTFMIRDSGAKMLILEEDIWNELRDMAKDVETLQNVFMVSSGKVPSGIKPFSALLASESTERVVEPVNEEDALFLMYTSGTTGLPKGAIGTHVGVIHNVINYRKILGTDANDSTLAVVPLFHVTGLIGQLIHMFCIGGRIVLMKNYKTDLMLQLLEQEKITFSFMVPTIYVLMLLNENLERYDLSSLRLAAYGGAPMALETISQLSQRFPNMDLRNAYGATETSSPATIMPAGEYLRKPSSVGKAVPGAHIKVMDENDREMRANEVGELWIKGSMVVPGYWNNISANQKEFVNGFWRSGDLGKIDEEGFIYILDRKKDMINRGGEKIYSIEVEGVLYGHPKILEASVVAVPDGVFGEQVKAAIVLRPGQKLDEEEVRGWVSNKLADYKVPKHVVFVTELPRNPGGKVIKSKVREL